MNKENNQHTRPLGRIESPFQDEKVYNIDMVVPIEEYTEQNDRIDGLRRLVSIDAPISSPVFIISHETYEQYKKDPEKAIEELDKAIKLPAQQAMANSKKNSIALRRAYKVPGLANPPGPNFLGVTDETIAVNVKKLFDFAQKRGFDKVGGAQIACFFYPFVDPENKPLTEVQREDVLPYGGHIIASPDDLNKFEILATYGNHQTLFLYERKGQPVESYVVEVDPSNHNRVKITKKGIVQKDKMHYTDDKGVNAIVDVPKTHQLQQVMYDSEIVDVTKHTARLVEKYGPQRAEFSFDGENFFFNETVDMKREVGIEKADYDAKGKVFEVKSREDVDRLAQIPQEKRAELIISAVDTLSGDVTYSDLAERFRGEGFTVLYAGTSRTAHLMRVLQDKGHFPFAVGKQDLREGDVVSITSDKGIVNFENITAAGLPEVTPLYLAHTKGREEVGGKAERISYLRQKGFDVPEGAVITIKFYNRLLKATGADKVLERAVLGGDSADMLSDLMGDKLSEIPDSLWEKITTTLNRYGLLSKDRQIIARSSANVEDQRGESFAGVFESYSGLRGENEVREGVLKTIQSTFSPRVLANIGEDNLEELLGIKMAVIVQEMVDARASGTLFGKDTQTGNQGIVTIEAKTGLGQEIVDGHGVGQRLVINKSNRKLVLSEGEPVITSEEVDYLLDLSELLEKKFRFPQDVEWSIGNDGKFWLFQSRDL